MIQKIFLVLFIKNVIRIVKRYNRIVASVHTFSSSFFAKVTSFRYLSDAVPVLPPRSCSGR